MNSAIDALSEAGSLEERFERFLRDPIAPAGDLNVLSMQLAECEVDFTFQLNFDSVSLACYGGLFAGLVFAGTFLKEVIQLGVCCLYRSK